jgi:hypothetical protein
MIRLTAADALRMCGRGCVGCSGEEERGMQEAQQSNIHVSIASDCKRQLSKRHVLAGSSTDLLGPRSKRHRTIRCIKLSLTRSQCTLASGCGGPCTWYMDRVDMAASPHYFTPPRQICFTDKLPESASFRSLQQMKALNFCKDKGADLLTISDCGSTDCEDSPKAVQHPAEPEYSSHSIIRLPT